MFLIAVLLLAIIVGYIRKGSLSNVISSDIRVPYLFMLALLLFLLVEAGSAAGWEIVIKYAVGLRFAAYIVLITSIFMNIQTMDIWPLTLLVGTVMNFTAIFSNVGKLPVSQRALEIAGIELSVIESSSYFELAGSSTSFAFLGGIIPIPLPGIFAQVISVGTLLIALGAFGYIQELMLGKIGSADETEEMDEDQQTEAEEAVSEEDSSDVVANEILEEESEAEIKNAILGAVGEHIAENASDEDDFKDEDDDFDDVDDYDDYDGYFDDDDDYEEEYYGDLFKEEDEKLAGMGAVIDEDEPADVSESAEITYEESVVEEVAFEESPTEEVEELYEEVDIVEEAVEPAQEQIIVIEDSAEDIRDEAADETEISEEVIEDVSTQEEDDITEEVLPIDDEQTVDTDITEDDVFEEDEMEFDLDFFKPVIDESLFEESIVFEMGDDVLTEIDEEILSMDDDTDSFEDIPYFEEEKEDELQVESDESVEDSRIDEQEPAATEDTTEDIDEITEDIPTDSIEVVEDTVYEAEMPEIEEAVEDTPEQIEQLEEPAEDIVVEEDLVEGAEEDITAEEEPTEDIVVEEDLVEGAQEDITTEEEPTEDIVVEEDLVEDAQEDITAEEEPTEDIVVEEDLVEDAQEDITAEEEPAEDIVVEEDLVEGAEEDITAEEEPTEIIDIEEAIDDDEVQFVEYDEIDPVAEFIDIESDMDDILSLIADDEEETDEPHADEEDLIPDEEYDDYFIIEGLEEYEDLYSVLGEDDDIVVSEYSPVFTPETEEQTEDEPTTEEIKEAVEEVIDDVEDIEEVSADEEASLDAEDEIEETPEVASDVPEIYDMPEDDEDIKAIIEVLHSTQYDDAVLISEGIIDGDMDTEDATDAVTLEYSNAASFFEELDRAESEETQDTVDELIDMILAEDSQEVSAQVEELIGQIKSDEPLAEESAPTMEELTEDVVASAEDVVSDTESGDIRLDKEDEDALRQTDSQYIVVDGKIVENPNYKLRRSSKTRFATEEEKLLGDISAGRRRNKASSRDKFVVKDDEE